MRNAYRYLRAALYFAQHHRYIPVAADFWTTDEAAELTRFFNGRTGLKLKTILNTHVTTLAVAATQADQTQRDKCGYANGARGLVATVESLMLSPASAHDAPELSDAGQDLLEQLSP